LIGAHIGDRAGNLLYRKTARNFGPVMATAAELTIAEVSKVLDVGQIDPENVVTPGIFRRQDPRGEPMTTTQRPQRIEHVDRGPMDRDELAAAIARDIPAGSYVNLGIGQPTLVADHLRPESGVVLHTENGMLDMGRAATGAEVDPDLINAGKMPVTETLGASYFHHADSFAMMRGGHLDVCVCSAHSRSAAMEIWPTGTRVRPTPSPPWVAQWIWPWARRTSSG
jgi:hypothetical protein